VCRLKGTNSAIAKEKIAAVSDELGIYYQEDFDTAARKIAGIVADL